MVHRPVAIASGENEAGYIEPIIDIRPRVALVMDRAGGDCERLPANRASASRSNIVERMPARGAADMETIVAHAGCFPSRMNLKLEAAASEWNTE
jgi:hypothetical protein